MYKLLLCWRYLRTRYIALASIVSVMLGVATMIVVNSVMAGFTTEMQDRLHGILSDLTFEPRTLEGAPDAEWHMEQIRRVAGDQIEAMAPTVVVPAMLSYQCGGNWYTRQIQLFGIDERLQPKVNDLAKYLQHEKNRRAISFALHEGGYDTRDHQAGPDAPERRQMEDAGWTHRRQMAEARALQERLNLLPPDGPTSGRARPGSEVSMPRPGESARTATGRESASDGAADHPAGAARAQGVRIKAVDDGSARTGPNDPSGVRPETAARAASTGAPVQDPFAGRPEATPPATDPFAAQAPAAQFDPARQQHTGLIGGIALFSFRSVDGQDRFLALPGDDVKLTFPSAGTPPKVVYDNFTIVDFYESRMSEYDSSLVFVPIRKLQELRGMIDPTSGVGNFNAIQIRLKPGADGDAVRDKLRAAFPEELYGVYTWRDKQGALLAAVHMETAILNVLLFLIIAVAGFGILAIFFMIVVEKTRDIGILKALGAPSRGVMGIFLGYGLSLGLVGSGVGMVLGLLFVAYINEIAGLLGWLTGQPIFDPAIYYFYEIPTIVEPATVAWIVVGALAIAVGASILPARRAARLHPVEALRYE